jgi:hypothetical protein
MQNVPSAAVNIIVSIIPIVGIVMGSVVVFFYLLWSHRQRMLMIEKGLFTRRYFDLKLFSLLLGLVLMGIGASLTLFFLLKEGLAYSVLSGLIPLGVGVSLLAFFIVSRNVNSDERERG